MNQLPLIPDFDTNEETPLPLIVAQRWNFPLAHIQTENGMVYAVQDWMRGVLDEKDIRNLFLMLCKTNPQFASSIEKFPYKTTNNKLQKRPYVKEDGLLFILIYSRLSRGRYRLAEIRNFIASLSPEYEYLKCREIKNRVLIESEFQTILISNLHSLIPKCNIHPYYQTYSKKVVDILIKTGHYHVLIECKVDKKDFYKAIGQVIAYQTELSQSIVNKEWILAIAMPYEIIDDYMREIIKSLPIRLISILNETVIDAVTGKPFANVIGRQAEETSLLMEMDLATGKALLGK